MKRKEAIKISPPSLSIPSSKLLVSDSLQCSDAHISEVKNADATYSTYKFLQIQDNETNDNIKFLQIYSIVAADAQLEISTAVIPVILLLDEHSPQKIFPVSRNVRRTFVSFRNSLSEYALLTASRKATRDFDAKSYP
jgi:hypothetical protein